MNHRLRPIPCQVRRQRGNTLIGIIIGLVIGLGIAVVVALAITKGATPFTDKGSKGGRQADTAGQVADPNKPMYGNKDTARDAVRNSAKEPAPAAPPPDALEQALSSMKPTPPVPAPATSAAPSVRAPVVEKSRPAPAEPVVEQPPAAAPAAAARADAGDDKFIYYLQVGAFREVADAESARAKLALLGFEAAVSDRATDNGVLHRVRMGPYNQVDAMNRARAKLSENGVDVAVVRNQK